MFKNLILLIFLVFLTLTLTLISSAEVIEEIVAVVNDDIITLTDFKNAESRLLFMLSQRYRGNDLEREFKKARENLLDQLINEILLLQEARKKNLDVKEELKLFIENLKKENNIDSDEELKREMEAQGINFEAWKKEVEKQILQQKIIMIEVDSKISLTDTELVNYYKEHSEEFTNPAEVRLKGIYLSKENRDEDELEKVSQEILRKLNEGIDFSTLASQYSDGPEKEKGGDLGFFKKGELNKQFEEAVFKLNPGEITPWLKTDRGWYLFKIIEKKEAKTLPFEEVKDKIREKLFIEKKQQKIKEYLKSLRENSYIKIYNPRPFD
ncbi:peptidylprolyl isomerase [Candidatus Aminicenantes bacterium AC-708-M15]|jgi:peptidyl-prolyl cis-trans isomerase SurA|nr:peptidylprolyl isomerase [SCandidatus Aminicenantes bacterium Aminicenantia_JdfR_composite]MCP2597145.1 peptidylprolyl isomerase [Candidatus Aminicenantes bacterium AC-335-G13]MCP2604294.1 peptidylprolyl isomerase [Candidatus Aminicenantes bacterium AC-708-M15]MCP2617986.1 peptidylprolyl isomerase [Candidatus Aminicenantes bacterium AC-335-A11]MCP2619468.1 peptidylprolyl isomerase [Candidatus Aminicenantes bacterium AC-335-K20]MCP2620710.1 peptidylprolyl isomerase [Candidatus Aminicenantes 